ncbi:hypothetical protein PSTG_14338 [Puccinia striiformis f. sp. tritici PST-78]|uniref:DUF7918 domain-containing protein n=1 Tax=Puccinia striiformis f. sp. tritici PST-78 TaxID=1165861 RepID=A0A0L0UZP4_9BASI|nr:hypothetical protein PSTG_14338 [Puccinia striiformis f. sp. tritici PST-78]
MPTNATSAASCKISLLDPPLDEGSTGETWTACPEYQHKSLRDSETGTVKETVTIESKQSRRFRITIDVHPTAFNLLEKTVGNSSRSKKAPRSLKLHDSLSEVFLDGVSVARYHRHRSDVGPFSVTRVKENQTSYRRLEFAPLKLVDPDEFDDQDGDPAASTTKPALCEDQDVIKALGTIEIHVYRCKLSREKKRITKSSSSNDTTSTKTTNQMSFSETIKTAASTTAGLGQSVIDLNKYANESAKRRRVEEQDPNPFLVFIFKHKPRSVLIDEKIIRLPTIPVGPSGKAVIEIESDSEPETTDTKPTQQDLDQSANPKRVNEDDGATEETTQKRTRVSTPIDEKPDIDL